MQLAWRTRLDTVETFENTEAGSAAPIAGDDDLAVVRLAQSDPRAFAPLYELYAPIVYHYCLRRLSDTEAASDATAIVFTKALAALPKFRPDPRREGSTFRGWLFTIAHNVVIDARRRNRNHLPLDAETTTRSHSPHLVDTAASPEDHAIGTDAARRVRQLLARLPDRQKSIVELRLAGLSGAEIAQSLGMSESAVDRHTEAREMPLTVNLRHEESSAKRCSSSSAS